MTRTEAEAEAKKLNETEPKWTCPPYHKPCVKTCVNFTPAFVINTNEESKTLHDIKEDTFEVVGFHCSNYSFVGPIFCDCD